LRQVNTSAGKIIYLFVIQFPIMLEDRTRPNEWQVYFNMVILKH